MTVFRSDEDCNTYIRFISEEATRFGVEILSWCLMTNHVHFVVVPSLETSLARTFGEAHRRFTCARNMEDNVKGYLFQGRFGSCVLDEDHLFAALRYVELNPVRAGMVETAWDHPWSSARFHIGKVDSDPLVKDRSIMGFTIDWNGFLSSEQNDMNDVLRKSTKTGRPAGNDTFIGNMERVTNRNLGYGKRGRPSRNVDK